MPPSSKSTFTNFPFNGTNTSNTAITFYLSSHIGRFGLDIYLWRFKHALFVFVIVMGKKSMLQSIENHLRVLTLLREEGPKSAVEIRKAIKIHPNTLYDLLDRIVRTKWAFVIKEGPHKDKYAFYWYRDLEWEIENLLKTKYSHVLKSGSLRDTMLIHIAHEMKVRETDTFKKAYFKVVNRLGLERMS